MQPGMSLDDIIARKRAQVKAKKSGKVIVAPVDEEVNEDDESGKDSACHFSVCSFFYADRAHGSLLAQ